MKLVIFGLTVSSSWGNGHATLLRGLISALARRGHTVVFFERDVPYYAASRDLFSVPGGELVLYEHWRSALPLARRHVADADAAMVISYCHDALAATELVTSASRAVSVFYDMDSPVTLRRLREGETVPYIGPRGLRDFDLVLSYGGGRCLDELKSRFVARRVFPLYGSVDPDVHRPVPPVPPYRCDFSYIGTYAADRQEKLERLFLEPAARLPKAKFLMAGSQYPHDFPWKDNVWYLWHLPPAEHPAFFCSSRLTLNITRGAMVATGFSPPGRIFEAAACGVPVVSDAWDGLDTFYAPGREIITASTADDVLAAIALGDGELRRIALRARERTLDEHTADRRATELLDALSSASGTTSAQRSAIDRHLSLHESVSRQN